MTDIIDRANRTMEQHTRQAIDAARVKPCGPSRQTCIDCDEKIPGERRKQSPGCTRCVECQADYEDFLNWRG